MILQLISFLSTGQRHFQHCEKTKTDLIRSNWTGRICDGLESIMKVKRMINIYIKVYQRSYVERDYLLKIAIIIGVFSHS